MEYRRFTVQLRNSAVIFRRFPLHVTEHLLFRKLCARWVPRQLTPEHKAKRMESALAFLQRYHDDGHKFLYRIIAGDEKWFAYITPETKQQSMHWRHSGSPCKMKFKQILSARKVMCTLFRGILLVDFLTRGEAVTVELLAGRRPI